MQIILLHNLEKRIISLVHAIFSNLTYGFLQGCPATSVAQSVTQAPVHRPSPAMMAM